MLARLKSIVAGAFWVLRQGGLREAHERLEQRANALERELVAVRQGLRQLLWPPDDLRWHARQVHSQNGEDGILAEIERRLGPGSRTFVEFGVEDGSECNGRRLVEAGWSGLFMELDAQQHARLAARYAGCPGVRTLQAVVTADTIEGLLEAEQVPQDLDLLSIDIDGNDYWVWQAVQRWRPRVVVIEYNAHHRPGTRWIMARDDAQRWDGTTYHGASLTALRELGERKGYRLVATDPVGVNAFFVREDLAGERFARRSDEQLYSPPLFGVGGTGHPVDPLDRPYETGLE